MKFSYLLFTVCCFALLPSLDAQESLSLEIVPFEIGDLPAMHSYAYASYDEKILVIGGRTSEEFSPSYPNYEIMVIDPAAEKFWTYPLEWVEGDFEEPDHLAACFAAQYQDNDRLYIVGGFGYSMESEAFGTFPRLTVVDVPKLMDCVINRKRVTGCFRQVEEEAFGMMGATLTKTEKGFLLSGGHQVFSEFDENGELIVKQNYPDYAVFFQVENQGKNFALNTVKKIKFTDDEIYGFVKSTPRIFPDGQTGASMFLNNETKDAKPFVNVFDLGYSLMKTEVAELPTFHSTVISLFDKNNHEMHTLFLGGCNDFLCSDAESFAPVRIDHFTKFSQLADGEITITQTALDEYLSNGRDALFIVNNDVPQLKNGIIDLNKLQAEKTLIGYIYGGATAPSPVFDKTGEATDQAADQIFRVYIVKENKDQLLGVHFPTEKNKVYTIHIPLD